MRSLLLAACGWIAAAGFAPGAAAQAVAAASQIGISPSLFEISLDEPAATHAYRLHNLGGRDTRVRVRVAGWTTDENNEVVLLPPSEHSLDQWVVINPVELDLPVNDSRAVRFSVRPAVPLPPGEHRAMVIFEEEPPPRDPAGAGTMSLAARFRISSAIYATTGAIERRGTIEALALAPDRLVATIASTGNAHVRPRGRARIRGLDDRSVDIDIELSKSPVLQGTTRRIATALPDGTRLKPGRYEVSVDGRLGDGDIALRQTLTVAAQAR